MTQLTMTPASVPMTTNLANIPSTLEQVIAVGFYSKFPAPWAASQGSVADPGIRVVVTNSFQTVSLAPMLVDVITDPYDSSTRYSIFAELETAQPGQTVDETVDGLPVTSMYLVLWPLSIGPTEIPSLGGAGQNIAVACYAV